MRRLLLVVVALAATLSSADDARAGCNLIPGTAKSFGAALGATNRPYAAPGERVEMRLRSCDPSPGFLVDGDDHVVTLLFRASAGATRHAVVLAADCAKVDLGPCSAAPGVVSATCREVAAGDLQTRVDLDEHDRRLNFVFPDTDALLAPDGDDVTLAGPVAIGVTAAGRAARLRSRDRAVCRAEPVSSRASTRSTPTTARAARRSRTRASRPSPRCRRRTTSRPTASRKVRRAPRRRPRPGWRSTPPGISSCRSAGAASWCATPACRCRASSGRAFSRRSRSRCRRRRSCIRSRPRAGSCRRSSSRRSTRRWRRRTS